ncbi:hypothetical protein T11_2288 [Trichinella zimbabwensis]|uniref:Uncharacterized protein n=1 Tax=Trichinella zimbabwensis TaxID=268475 RepID=A0A0V1GTG1_9BILA|nr:hypothetical protein T11_2288 [Trichinella zimbabwensis]
MKHFGIFQFISVLKDSFAKLFFSMKCDFIIPRLLSQLVAEDVPKETLLGSLRRIATSEAVLNISDTKARCNTLQAFLNVLSELGILQESEKDTLMAISYNKLKTILKYNN